MRRWKLKLKDKEYEPIVYAKTETDAITYFKDDGSLYIHTLKGEMKCDLNSYIVQDVRGEIYPCRQDIFEETYMAVEE